MRRDVAGGKRGDGHRCRQRRHRADPDRIRLHPTDQSLTGYAGLVAFARFARQHGVDAALRAHLEGLLARGRHHPVVPARIDRVDSEPVVPR